MSRLIRCNIVSELGIEKVVVELNSFRQRTAMIKEEISKVSRALTERAAQLNDLVNKSLGQLREQLGGTTLSGYLALQGRYQSGEMNDQDYSQQKDYYRGELQNMIRKLDESKKLMMIMAQLDSNGPVLRRHRACRGLSRLSEPYPESDPPLTWSGSDLQHSGAPLSAR